VLAESRQVDLFYDGVQISMMMKSRSTWDVLLLFSSWALIGLIVAVASGCNQGKPPRSPAAVQFKKEVQDAFERFVPPLVGPVSKGDKAGVLLILEQRFDESVRAGYPLDCIISILDRKGVTMASQPPMTAGKMNYSHYEAVKEAYKKKRIIHLVNYLQDGSRLYTIAAPLLKNGKAIGLLSLSYDSQELYRKYRMTDQDFLAIDFHRPTPNGTSTKQRE
jgi:hypothetical protein